LKGHNVQPCLLGVLELILQLHTCPARLTLTTVMPITLWIREMLLAKPMLAHQLAFGTKLSIHVAVSVII